MKPSITMISALVLAMTAGIWGCSPSQTAPAKTAKSQQGVKQRDPRLERVHKILLPLKKGLKRELVAAMKAGGVQRAVQACKLKAPEIVQMLQDDNVKVGRTTRKPRNPDNKPEPWLEPLLTHFEKRPPKVGAHKLVTLAEGGYGYVEPIHVNAFCLKCHGSKLKPEVAEVLKKHYPQDQATGYKAGDFRGLFWVKVLK